MITLRHIRALLAPWFAYRRKRLMQKISPAYAATFEQEREQRKKHGRVNIHLKTRRAIVLEMLKENR